MRYRTNIFKLNRCIVNSEKLNFNDEIEDFLYFEDFFEKLSQAQIPKGSSSKEEIWEGIEDFIGENKNTESSIWYFRLAASIALVLGVFLIQFLSQRPNDRLLSLPQIDTGSFETISYNTLTAESEKIVLPDGSKIILHSSSNLSFQHSRKKRTTELSGIAFFDVLPGSLFEVTTPHGLITVLGTSFLVKAKDDTLYVACKEGKVKVKSHDQGVEVILEAGESILVKGSENYELARKEEPATVPVDHPDASFYFENVPAIEALRRIEERHHITIFGYGFDKKYFTGHLDNSEVDRALTIICEPLDLEYTFLDKNRVRISPKPDN